LINFIKECTVAKSRENTLIHRLRLVLDDAVAS